MRSKPKILVVDDNGDICFLLHECLVESGFDVIVANHGEDAVMIVNNQGLRLNGIVTDIDLGSNVDGWQITMAARTINHRVSVVYMSGSSGDEWLARGVPHSVFVGKPFAPAQIITALSASINAMESPS